MHSETCICCGREIPEGRQVCPLCELNLGETVYYMQDFAGSNRNVKISHDNLQKLEFGGNYEKGRGN